MDSTVGIKMKFCESLDRFVSIRAFTPEQKQQLFKNVKITDKKSYKRLIINASVVNYLDEIAPLVFGNNEYPLLGEIIEQELYNLCVKVNPSLDIKEVTIQIDEQEAAGSSIPVINAEGAKESNQDRFLGIEDHLRKRIVGQDEAVSAVAQAIRKAKVGLKNHSSLLVSPPKGGIPNYYVSPSILSLSYCSAMYLIIVASLTFPIVSQ